MNDSRIWLKWKCTLYFYFRVKFRQCALFVNVKQLSWPSTVWWAASAGAFNTNNLHMPDAHWLDLMGRLVFIKWWITADRTWWRHQMETFCALLAICAGNSPVAGEFLAQRPVTRSFDVFFDLCLNKRLSKQSWGWWFETLSRPLWRHRNEWKVSKNRNEIEQKKEF